MPHVQAGSAVREFGGNQAMSLRASIEGLFAAHGARPEAAGMASAVSPLEHALQCARLAERAGAGDALVAAALLHDVGRLGVCHGEVDRHDLRGAAWLASHLGVDVIEPIRLHVAAKRYLVATDPRYAAALPEEARCALHRQGGPMSSYEVWIFGAQPYAGQAIALRHWDDAARRPGLRTPGLDHYLPLLEALRDRPIADVVE
jgi:predicted HD phosphohydrolase